MAKRPVDETETVPMEVGSPYFELVNFKTQSKDGDYYNCRKLAEVKGAFTSNLTTADKCIQTSWAIQGNGQSRVTLIPEEEVTEGYLLIVGTK